MDVHEHIAQYDFQKLIQKLEQWLDFKRWGFKLIYSNPAPKSAVYYIVYQSEQCKIRFRWEQDRPYESPSISESYGRSHAPPNESYLMWNGEKCLCWHHIARVINFFDGVSPMESESNFSLPKITHGFYRANIGKFEQPEYIAKLTTHIWDHYGQRIFDLFDVRQTDLWDQYIDFVEECGRISEEKARSKGHAWIGSDLYKIC